MIDFHTHILPELDDGADTKETSVALLKKELLQGVSSLIFTPHYYGKIRTPEQFLQERKQAFEKIKGEIPSGLTVKLGAEVRFEKETLIPEEQFRLLAIENTRYILIEFPFEEEWSETLFSKLARLCLETSLVPVLAHIERYPAVQKNPKILNEFVRRGWLLQTTTSAFMQKKLAPLAFAMLKKGLVHCIGTDTHNLDDRAPDYTRLKALLYERGFGETFEKIQKQMRFMLENKRVLAGEYKTVRKIFWTYR